MGLERHLLGPRDGVFARVAWPARTGTGVDFVSGLEGRTRGADEDGAGQVVARRYLARRVVGVDGLREEGGP